MIIIKGPTRAIVTMKEILVVDLFQGKIPHKSLYRYLYGIIRNMFLSDIAIKKI